MRTVNPPYIDAFAMIGSSEQSRGTDLNQSQRLHFIFSPETTVINTHIHKLELSMSFLRLDFIFNTLEMHTQQKQKTPVSRTRVLLHPTITSDHSVDIFKN